MASTSAVTMSTMQLAPYTKSNLPSSASFFSPMTVRPSKPISAARGAKIQVRASLTEKAVTGLTAAALTASMVMPEAAEAAVSGLTPSLNNFLLSIGSGGVVLAGIIGVVLAVSSFDPVKRTE
uniref:Chloroplast photosystem II subunit X n=2 Tax=Oenothera grandiflora TaxID=49455 RepID=B1PPX6_9MYRT|nr:chloroplast photosystem II subunit X [Oenothera grandiflora]